MHFSLYLKDGSAILIRLMLLIDKLHETEAISHSTGEGVWYEGLEHRASN